MPVAHIDHVIVPKTHSPMYMMHKVRAYIECYSKAGEIVLDPFVGSGVTALEAVAVGRKAVAIDLNPMATFITRCTAMPCELKDLKREFERVEGEVKGRIEELYQTRCPIHPDEQSRVLCGIWEGDSLVGVWVECAAEGAIQVAARPEDREQVEAVAKRALPHWAPSFEFPPGVVFDQAIREAGDHLCDLFTPRAWHALSLLYWSIAQAKEGSSRSLLLLAFTSMLGQVSKMVPQREGARLSGNVGWTVNSYWVPPERREFNVWNSFCNRFGRIVSGKEQTGRELQVKFAASFDDLAGGESNLLVVTRSALDLSEVVPRSSVDYVFTDPPYGGSIPYMELSTLWAEWAAGPGSDPSFGLNLKEEITVDPKYQGKDFQYYHMMLRSVFRQVYGCLKPGRYGTITFHNPEIRVWNSIVSALAEAGFGLDKILYQPPPRASIGGLSRPYGSAIGDYYLRLAKVKTREEPKAADSERLFEHIVVETAKRIIAERGEPTPYTFILNGIVPAWKQAGVLLGSKKGWNQVLKEHVGSEFVLTDVMESGKIVGQNWALAHPEDIPYLDVVPLSERVERSVVDLLRREVKASFDEVLQDVFTKFPNAMTPTSKSVSDVLGSVAEKTVDGKWQLRAEIQARENQHATMIRYLTQLGLSGGFTVYVAPPALAISGVLSALPEGVGAPNPERVSMIDVLWVKKGEITHAFEVENTTGFIAAIARGSNLRAETERFMVLPEERADELARKLSDPSVAADYERYGWRRIFYNRLEDFCERTRARRVEIDEVLGRIVENPMAAKFGIPLGRRARRRQRTASEQIRMD